MKTKQKTIFLQSEGDEWFLRNKLSLSQRKLPEDDSLLMELLDCKPISCKKNLKVLEIGCGDGSRLAWMKKNFSFDCYGVDPSEKAIAVAIGNGVKAQKGSADLLPFQDQFFDLVIFGFCLYLCDREDLFKICSESDRVLKKSGWIAIQDFFSPTEKINNYHHKSGLSSYKMDYTSMFLWHPAYTCITNKVRDHKDASYTDDFDEMVAISLLRKIQK